MQPHVLPLLVGEPPWQIPDPGGHADTTQVMEQSRLSHGGHLALRELALLGGSGSQSGYPTRMVAGVRALEVSEVGHGAQGCSELLL